jgi:hypothetical protein
VGDQYSLTTGLFPVESKTAEPWLTTGIDIRYDFNRVFDISLGWEGRFFGAHPYIPPHVVDAGLSYRNAGDTFGGGLEVSVPVLQLGEIMPDLTLDAFYRVTEAVKLRLEVVDPLSLLMPGGRIYWSPYEAPGFHVFIGTNISL